MTTPTPPRATGGPPDPDRIDLDAVSEAVGAFTRFCVGRWRLYAVVVGVALALSVLHSVVAERSYVAVVKVLPYRSARTDLGGLSGLAGLAGISLPTGSLGPVVSTDAYPELVASFSFRARLLQRPIRFVEGPDTLSRWLSRRSGTEEAPVRMEARDDSLTSLAQATAQLGPEADHRPAPLRLPASFVRQVKWVGSRVHTSVERQTGIVTTEARMPDPVAAADLAREASDLLTRDLIRYETRRASEQGRFLQEQQAEAEVRHRSAQLAVARFRDQNRMLTSAVSNVELERLQRELAVADEVLRSLTVQLESSRVKERETTPVMAMLEPAVVPTRPAWPRPALSLFLMGLLGAAAATAWLLVEYRRGPARTPPSSTA